MIVFYHKKMKNGENLLINLKQINSIIERNDEIIINYTSESKDNAIVESFDDVDFTANEYLNYLFLALNSGHKLISKDMFYKCMELVETEENKNL